MKNLILTLTLFFLNTPLVFSQTSIPSELMNKPRTEELYKVNDTKIDKLTVTETNYLEDVTYTNKWVYNYIPLRKVSRLCATILKISSKSGDFAQHKTYTEDIQHNVCHPEKGLTQ